MIKQEVVTDARLCKIRDCELIDDNNRENKSKKSKPKTLLHLYYNASQAEKCVTHVYQEEIRCWYLFAEKFEERVKKIKIAPSILLAPEDITLEIINQLIRGPDQLPNKFDLANFLNESPPVKIPIAPNHYFQFNTSLGGITKEERDTYFVLSTEAECTSLYLRLIAPLIYPPSYGKTEDSYHCLWNSIIKNTIETFGMHSGSLSKLEFDRNTSRNHPDMVVLVGNVCPFRGEEKSREDSEDPSSELVDKIEDWSYGDALYIFAYYAIGVQVTLVILYKPENKKRKLNVCSEKIAEFDLGRLSNRIRIMNFLRNICRLLPLIANLCPPRESPEFQTIFRPSGTVIELGYTIKKKFADERRVTHLKEIYGMLSANNIRFSNKLEYASTHSVNLAPRGEQCEPNDLKELLQALICTLTCLKIEDVRWPNIIRHYDEYQKFILIDFDYANFSPSDEPLEEFSESDHAPEMLTKGHNFKVDIWGVGNLIGSCNITGIPPELSGFGTDLCKSNPNKRPTASVALDRAKDIFREWFPDDDWLERIETA
ncbi:4822_t:CDS:2 [Cetraspora pellucida]|uniref:4822_t:CDS:1 n=1 Tax=Cetraspora pellucida TaxID=1433469 RepID=A0ACA9JZI3_9GLOM|nr:4822_t:CDS:2 [Cetraspora pellucida]